MSPTPRLAIAIQTLSSAEPEKADWQQSCSIKCPIGSEDILFPAIECSKTVRGKHKIHEVGELTVELL